MAVYRQVHINFWTDTKIHDYFTAEDKFFYLYLLTNHHTSLNGCYEISILQMSEDTGKTENEVKILLDRMENLHKVVKYDFENREMLVLNWYKYNWNDSPKLKRGVMDSLKTIKNKAFKDYVQSVLDGEEAELTEETSIAPAEKYKSKKEKESKHKYGEYQKVMLTGTEFNKLVEKFGEENTNRYIKYLDEAIAEKGYKYKSHYIVIAKEGSWVRTQVDNTYSANTVKLSTSNPFLKMVASENMA